MCDAVVCTRYLVWLCVFICNTVLLCVMLWYVRVTLCGYVYSYIILCYYV